MLMERITGSDPGPHVLITGGVHGDEFEPMAAIRRLIGILRGEKLSGLVTLVPVVNEPAFRLGRRTADDGLDLARTCPGREDGSVTERIAFELSGLIRTADYYLDLHTGGTRLRVLPLVGYTLHPDIGVLEAQRRMARAFGLPIIWGTDPNLEGRSLSVARDARVPAIYAEYHGGGGCDPAGIDAYVHGCLRVLADLDMIAKVRRGQAPFSASAGDLQAPKKVPDPLPDPPPPLIVEDNRPGAGHMQINHPAPSEGFFEAAVELGQQVRAGSLLGTVTDPLARNVRSIHAAQSGIVLVLHTFARVDAGEGVAVILGVA